MYLARLQHYRFAKDGDELVVTSERDDSFEVRYGWPDDLSTDDDDLEKELHTRFYLDVVSDHT